MQTEGEGLQFLVGAGNGSSARAAGCGKRCAWETGEGVRRSEGSR
jgi:hypothetical protein